MGYITLANGLTLTIPTNGTRNWGQTLQNATWNAISSHDHTGSGNGNKLSGDSLETNIVIGLGSTATPTGTAQTLDFNQGMIQTLDLSLATGDVTLSFLNPIEGAVYTLWVIQGAAFRDLIFPGNVLWPQGQAPILTQTALAVDCIKLYYTGTDYRGMWEVDWR